MKVKYPIATTFFVAIFLLSTFLKILPVLNDNFPFTMDQGRDMLDIRNIVVGHHLTLIGPTTSLNGLFLGPFWYYFNVPPFIVGAGDPASLVYWLMFWYQLTAVIIFFYLLRRAVWLGLFFSGLFLMVPVFFYSSRFSWSANPMPFMTAFYFLLIITIKKQDYLIAALIGAIAGLSMQFEAAFAVIFFPFGLLWLTLNRASLKNIGVLTLSFTLTLLPQLFFELRHNFVMTHTLLSELSGRSKTLGDSLSFLETATGHFQSYLGLFYNLTKLPEIITNLLWIATFTFLTISWFKKKLSPISRNSFLASLLFIVLSYLFYLTYRYPLKGWYILGLHLPLLLILAAFFSELFGTKKIYLKLLIAGLLVWNFVNIFPTQSTLIPKPSDRSSDPSNLRNQLEVIDYVYSQTNGQPFKVYNYIPSVYDFPYQYLFWWHGTKTYGYQPDTITYLDRVPPYIHNNSEFQNRRKIVSGSDYPIFLIYQSDKDNPDRLNAWMNNFEKLCPQKIQPFNFETTVQIRRQCRFTSTPTHPGG